MIRPQRASLEISIMGAKVQFTPCAADSKAAILADSSMASRSQLAVSPSGTGNMVLYPWITSYPKIKGILSLEFSMTSFWASVVASTESTLSMEPTMPFLRFSSFCLLSISEAGPVRSQLPLYCTNCPIFSSRVIRFKTESTLVSTFSTELGISGFCACAKKLPKRNTRMGLNFFIFFIN